MKNKTEKITSTKEVKLGKAGDREQILICMTRDEVIIYLLQQYSINDTFSCDTYLNGKTGFTEE